MMALYGDQIRDLGSSEFHNPEIINLKFWRDFQIVGFLFSLILIPMNFILYINLKRGKKQIKHP
jgi:hypothetical protein